MFFTYLDLDVAWYISSYKRKIVFLVYLLYLYLRRPACLFLFIFFVVGKFVIVLQEVVYIYIYIYIFMKWFLSCIQLIDSFYRFLSLCNVPFIWIILASTFVVASPEVINLYIYVIFYSVHCSILYILRVVCRFFFYFNHYNKHVFSSFNKMIFMYFCLMNTLYYHFSWLTFFDKSWFFLVFGLYWFIVARIYLAVLQEMIYLFNYEMILILDQVYQLNFHKFRLFLLLLCIFFYSLYASIHFTTSDLFACLWNDHDRIFSLSIDSLPA